MPPILEILDLVKSYGSLHAVDGVSFKVEQGICFGLLGPNGAGKTTALEVIEDILQPTSGKILYKGNQRSSSFREEIGIQFQHTSLLNFLSVRETLQTFHKLYQHAEEIEILSEICNLHEILEQRNNRISGGQRQRLLLALALINKPDLLFLDEPSTGLDPQARHNLWSIVQDVQKKGKTIILTTHSMEETEFLCDEIAIMDHGKIIAIGSPKDLIQEYTDGGSIILPQQCIHIPFEHLPFSHKVIDDFLEIQVFSKRSA